MERLLTYLSTFASDLRLEVVLADLIESGFNLDEVRVQPIGLGRRRFDRDIAKIKYEANDEHRGMLTVSVNREGIYDALPQGLFHQPQGRKQQRSKKEVLEEMKFQRKKERAARAFFLPLEQEFFRSRAWIETKERALLQFQPQEMTQTVVTEDFWNLPKCLNPRQQLLATYLLPLAHLISANLPLAEVCLRNFLDEDVQIHPHAPIEESIDDTASLADVALGTDFVLGGLVSDGLPTMDIFITASSTQALRYFLTEQGKALLDFLANAFLPMESQPHFTLNTDHLETGFLLTEDDSGLLGFTTTLC